MLHRFPIFAYAVHVGHHENPKADIPLGTFFPKSFDVVRGKNRSFLAKILGTYVFFEKPNKNCIVQIIKGMVQCLRFF